MGLYSCVCVYVCVCVAMVTKIAFHRKAQFSVNISVFFPLVILFSNDIDAISLDIIV